MVGKNVCHTVVFDKSRLNKINAKNPASYLFKEAAEMYFQKENKKKFHDPVAACLHLHPDIATWILGKTVRIKNEWTTFFDESGYKIAVDIDRDLFWDLLLNFS